MEFVMARNTGPGIGFCQLLVIGLLHLLIIQTICWVGFGWISSVESQNIISGYVLHSEMRCSGSQPTISQLCSVVCKLFEAK